MRRRESTLDPTVARELEVLDAALAGEPVGDADLELAALAVALRDGRERPSEEFAARLDERVANRFGRQGTSRSPMRWALAPAVGIAATIVLVLAVVLTPGGGKNAAVHQAAKVPAPAPANGDSNLLSGGAPEAAAPAAAAAPATGRLVEKSASLDLGVPANHLQPVAGRVVAITAQLGGIIDSSNVNDTGGADGGAQFALRVPSAQLETALARLSQIPNAHLRSRSDSSQDINAPFVSARRRLATATAERRALLRALANATTQSRIDALKAQIAATDRTIAITGTEVRALQRRASFSRIALQIEATAASHGGGAALDPGSGLRTAAKVLGAAIAVALVGLAAIAPLALVLTVAWGAAFALRRRRRERALGPA